MEIARKFPAAFFPSNFFRRLLSFGSSSDGDPTRTTGRIFPVSFFSSDSLLRRLRSFGSSDDPNQTTAEFNYPSPRSVEDPIQRAMEMETGSPTAADPEQDSKRVKKLVPTVSLAVAALCCGIYASIPPTVQLHPHSPLLYNSLTAFVSLGVFTSLGVLMYSLVRPEGAEVVWVQSNLVFIVIAFFLIAFVLRIALLLPVASFGYVWLVFFLVAAAIALYLYTAWNKDHRNHSARDPDNRLPISLPRSDGGGN